MEIPSAEQSINLMVHDIHKMAASHAPVGIGLGIVIQAPPDLTVAWNGILLTKEQLYVSDFLLLGYTRNWKGTFKAEEMKGSIRTNTQTRKGGSGDPSYTSHSHKINDDYKADTEAKYTEDTVSTDYGLKAGDVVTVLPIEGAQKFIVLSKLEYLAEWQPPSDNYENSN